jgi:glycosyltransferase involved in cell wall biosynthesis
MLNLLKYFGKISSSDKFLLYFAKRFSKNLTPSAFPSYVFKKLGKSFFWTQTKFAFALWKDNPDVLWMPVVNLPFLKRKKLKTVITVHDLAFKYFPTYFPKKDLKKLNFLADFAIHRADKIIAVSHSTKKDILKFYPRVDEKKIQVIYHGFDGDLFSKKADKDLSNQILSKFKIPCSDRQNSKFILYVGAIQPRKNIETLVRAFEKISEKYPDLNLVIAGEKAWLWEDTLRKIEKSSAREKIILVGKVPFEKLPILYQNAAVFVFPSIYEGFGIPLLEAFASGVPVICASNSSLLEIGEDAVLFFETKNHQDLADKLNFILGSEKERIKMIERGYAKVKNFSWEKCSQETLRYLKK